MKRFLFFLLFLVLLSVGLFFGYAMVINESPQRTWARIVDSCEKLAGLKAAPSQAPPTPTSPAPKPPPVVMQVPPPPPTPPTPAFVLPSAPIRVPPPDPVTWLIKHKDQWPTEVILRETTEFPVIYQGKISGKTWIPGGNSVSLVSIEGDNAMVLVGKVSLPVPIAATDLAAIAKTEMGKLNAEATTVTPPPNGANATTTATPPDTSIAASATTSATTAKTLGPVVLPPGEKSPLITSFTPTAHEVRNETSGLIHPGILQTKAQLDTMQRHVRNGDQPWASAFAGFSKEANCSTNPRILYAGWTDIPRGGGLGKGGNYVTFRMAKDANTAYKQAVMWYITGDETYRLNALKIIRDYCAIKTVAPHWDAQIRWGVASYQLCCAAEVLRYSDANSDASRWTDDDTAQFSALLQAGEQLITGTGYWMNQHGFSTAGEMGTAIFLDDKALYDEAVERTTVNSRGQSGGRNGSIKWQMRLVTENFLTHEQVKPQVQLVEMMRDQNHAGINVAALSTCCQTIYNQGTKVDPVTGRVSTAADAIDAFDFLDNRLLAGTDYFTRFALGEPVTWIPIDMGSQIKGQPRGYNDLGILYNHYKYIEKWPTTDPRFRAVAEVYESLIPEPAAIDFPNASTLLLTPDEGMISPASSTAAK